MRTLIAILALAALGGCATPQQQFASAKSAADAGDANAQYQVARMYYFGRGVPQDYAMTAKWLREAVNRGHVRSVSFLAGMYMRGEGVSVDYVEARRLLETGTAGGDVACLGCLAWLLATCPDDGVRDGARALTLAKRLVSIDGRPGNLNTLAAAYAASGNYEEAVRTQEQAIEKLRSGKYRNSDLVEMRNHLIAYQAGKPWLDPAN